MTDTQTIAATITAAAALIAGAIKWGSGRMAKAQDRSIAALIRSAESNATLAAKFEGLTNRIEALTERFDRLVEAFIVNGAGIVAAASAGTATGPVGKDGKARPKTKPTPTPRATTGRGDEKAE